MARIVSGWHNNACATTGSFPSGMPPFTSHSHQSDTRVPDSLHASGTRNSFNRRRLRSPLFSCHTGISKSSTLYHSRRVGSLPGVKQASIASTRPQSVVRVELHKGVRVDNSRQCFGSNPQAFRIADTGMPVALFMALKYTIGLALSNLGKTRYAI